MEIEDYDSTVSFHVLPIRAAGSRCPRSFGWTGEVVLRPIRLVTLAPGHFHAALVQKEMMPGVDPRVYVYAPLDYDLLAHLARIQGFNTRTSGPTRWNLDVRVGPDYMERFEREPAGNTAIIAGRNRPKADRILAALAAGLHVLADKPWVIHFADFPKLEQILREADNRDLVAFDMMTERHEVTNILQRELMDDPNVFGTAIPGTAADPGLILESVHYLKKSVAGRPLVRPSWWFDSTEAGDGLADVGTHLAELAMWLLFPDEPIDYRRDVTILAADRSSLTLTRAEFTAVTGSPEFPPHLHSQVQGEQLQYAANGSVTYTLRGVHVRLGVTWEYAAEPGHTDTHESMARGTLANVAIRSAPRAGGNRPEVYVAATSVAAHESVLAAVRRRCEALQAKFPGVAAVDLGGQIHVIVPDTLRVGHEAHFAEVIREFHGHFHSPRQTPSWERPNLLAKYYVTTKAIELAKRNERGS